MVLMSDIKLELVPNDILHEYDIDHEEASALVARITSVHTLLIVTATKRRGLHHMDVKMPFFMEI